MMKQKKQSISLPGLRRGLTVLEMLGSSEQGVRFSTVTRRLGVSKPTVSRLLGVLGERGYVVKDAHTQRYRPGPRLGALPAVPIRRRLCDAGTEVIRRLSEETSNTVLLLYWTGEAVHCVDKVAHPAACTLRPCGEQGVPDGHAPWDVLLVGDIDAWLSAGHEKGFFLRNPDRWRRQHRKYGFVFDDANVHRHVRRFASTIRDERGRLVGAVGLGGNVLTIPDDTTKDVGRRVRQAADEISHALGFQFQQEADDAPPEEHS